MHIAASKPLSLDVNDLEPNILKKEKQILRETIISSKKPENIIEKILEGKMNKYYSEVTLLNQPYILDTDKQVKNIIEDFSKNNNFNIIDYKLLILGEE